MADAYTEFLNLTKPEVGASRDSWGDKQNANLGKIDVWAKQVSDIATGAKAIADAAMPKAGGDFSGRIRVVRNGSGMSFVQSGGTYDQQSWNLSQYEGDGQFYFQAVKKDGTYLNNLVIKKDGGINVEGIGDVKTAIDAAAKAGNDALAKAVAKTGDTMTGPLRMTGGDTGQGVIFKHTDGGGFRVRMIGGSRLQFCDDAMTVEYFSFGSGGDISTRQWGDANTYWEGRCAAHQNAAANRCVTQVRWVMAGQKGYNDQPGTGGFISPFGGHAMNCDYWSWRFAAADGQVGSAPFAGRWRALQVYIANNGDWVTIGAAS